MNHSRLKTCMGIAIALPAILLLIPAWCVIAAIIYLDDGGPVLFCQQRLGKHRKPFTLLKFRTMRDNKITKPGQWLRTRGLDETLQLLMVLNGTMSLVGPRPLTDADVQRIGWQSTQYNDRWLDKPGITGLAQLFAGSGAKASLFLDRHYNQHANPLLDLQIILLSAAVNLCTKKRVQGWLRAYKRRHRPRSHTPVW